MTDASAAIERELERFAEQFWRDVQPAIDRQVYERVQAHIDTPAYFVHLATATARVQRHFEEVLEQRLEVERATLTRAWREHLRHFRKDKGRAYGDLRREQHEHGWLDGER
jgi:hypothetical protein